MQVKSLGEDQLKWLSTYGTIALDQWRRELLPIDGNYSNRHRDWYYVGDWRCCDDSWVCDCYEKRRQNLINNRYFYWPTAADGKATKHTCEQ